MEGRMRWAVGLVGFSPFHGDLLWGWEKEQILKLAEVDFNFSRGCSVAPWIHAHLSHRTSAQPPHRSCPDAQQVPTHRTTHQFYRKDVHGPLGQMHGYLWDRRAFICSTNPHVSMGWLPTGLMKQPPHISTHGHPLLNTLMLHTLHHQPLTYHQCRHFLHHSVSN